MPDTAGRWYKELDGIPASTAWEIGDHIKIVSRMGLRQESGLEDRWMLLFLRSIATVLPIHTEDDRERGIPKDIP